MTSSYLRGQLYVTCKLLWLSLTLLPAVIQFDKQDNKFPFPTHAFEHNICGTLDGRKLRSRKTPRLHNKQHRGRQNPFY